MRSRAFITAVNGGLCGLAGLSLGGYGVDLVRLHRPDFEYRTLLAAAIVGGLGWCVGALATWRLARPRPAPSRPELVLLALGAVVVLWLGLPFASSLRYAANMGPMIDGESLDDPLRPAIALAYLADVMIVAVTLSALAASGFVASFGRRVPGTSDRRSGAE